MAAFEVLTAEYAGACYGVQRALDLTQEAARSNKTVCTLGPLIHNPRVVNELANQGIEVVDTPEAITQDAVVIRSHGVIPQVLADLESRDLVVINATCPYVMRAQNAAASLAQKGSTVLVVGEAGHPEVESISQNALVQGGACTIVGSVADIPDELVEPVGIVVQTTQPREKLLAVVEALRARGIDPEVKDTICFATQQRQQAAIDLAKEVDVMLVLGGRNSSNTTRLYELCHEYCDHGHHIEDAQEIQPEWFTGISKVGVTAGASTPENQIRACLAHLCELADTLS